jgi:integrase/recombinase XerD
MSPLRQALAGYLAVRRALGYKLARPEKLLAQFIAYLEDQDATTVTTEHALAWATQPAGDQSWHACRMTAVRGFATYLRTVDPAAEVPPAGLVPWKPCRATPYLYSDADVAALIAAAAKLRFPLRTATYQTLIGLLAVTGMRVGEVIRLDRPDADLDGGVLTVRESKFGKSRLVPLQASVMTALRQYDALRDQLMPGPEDPAFFISLTARRLIYAVVCPTFRSLVDAAGVGIGAPHPPRLHELRHSFAVRTLLRWYRAGDDVQAKIPSLSTYMGHREPRHTYHYLSAAPELLALAAARRDDIRKAPRS